MFPKISPIVPVRRRDLFQSAEWVYELKHDGFRALAYLDAKRCRLISRRGNEMKRFADLSACIAKELKVKDAILDGEIIALDGAGRPAFYSLRKRECPAVYYAFDILWLNGRDVRNLPLVERKKILRKVIPRKSSSVGCVSYVDRGALKAFRAGEERGSRGLSRKTQRRQIFTAGALVQNIESHLY